MLFHVRMTVRLPHDLSAERADQLKKTERERAQELQRAGTWRHLWRVAGQYANVSVFDVSGPQELHDILSTLPLFPFMDIEVSPLCLHPSAIRDDITRTNSSPVKEMPAMSANLISDSQMKKLAEQASGIGEAGGDARVKEVTNRLLYRMMQVIDECDVTMDEFWGFVGFLAQTAKNNEFGLLVPGVALEHFLDLRLDEAEKRAGIKGGTLRTIEGPLYVAGAPLSKGEARMDDGTDPGEPFLIEGQVRGEDGNVIPGAIVDLWHANSKGGYSFIDGEQAPYNLRRRIETDAKGRYIARSIVPNGYGCPPESCTRKAMNLLGRHAERPAHVHFFITAPGYRKLTTQFNFTGDKYLYTDFAFGTRDELVVTLERVTDAAEIRNAGFNRPFARAKFDIVLTKEKAGAPRTEVEREHVVAA